MNRVARAALAAILAVALPATALAHGTVSANLAPGTALALVQVRGSVGSAPSVIGVHIEPEDRAGDQPVLLNMWKPGTNLRVLREIAPTSTGLYTTEAALPEGGAWRAWVRFGPGQAGYAGFGTLWIAESGRIDASATVDLRDGLVLDAPAFVQPFGYAVFALVAALAAALTGFVLARLARRPPLEA